MELKTTDHRTMLSVERTITIPEIAGVSAELCPALAEDAERHGLTINGPWTFVAHNRPGDGRTAFRIEICLPVSAGGPYRGKYTLKSLEPILCASCHYKGALRSLFSDGYDPLLRAITIAGHGLSGESREVYHRWRGPDAADNWIEIQIGLR